MGRARARSVGLISLPDTGALPVWELGRRLLMAFAILFSAPS
jgi:hypothetical protein